MEAAETGQPQATETYRQKLNAGENLWPWKCGLRVILLVVAIIGIGCVAWAVSNIGQRSVDYEFYDDDTWAIPWGLITLPLSFIWSAICLVVLLVRKRPAHPGVAVGLDLILWLALIVTTLFAAAAAYNTSSFGAHGYIEDYEYGNGEYYLAPNGTWVYNTTTSSSDYYYENTYSRSDRDCQPDFNSCAEEDALVNQLWHERNHRVGVEWTAVACQALAVLLHFALFVWACCDTHARNSRRTRREAEGIAEKIIMDLREKGQILPAQGAQQMRQPLLGRTEETAATGNGTSAGWRGRTTLGQEQEGYGISPRVSGQDEENHGISPVAPVLPETVRDV